MTLFGLLQSTKSSAEIYDLLVGFLVRQSGGEGFAEPAEVDTAAFQEKVNKHLGRKEFLPAVQTTSFAGSGKDSILKIICMGNFTSLLKLMLALKGVDKINVDAKDEVGNTLVYHALKLGNNELAKVLIEAGADVHLPNNEGTTCFHCALACSLGDLSTLQLLKGKGVDMSVVDSLGMSPLLLLTKAMFDPECSFSDCHIDAMKFIIDSGGGVYNEDIADEEGTTMLMLIAQRAGGHPNANDLIQFLIMSERYRCDVRAEDSSGCTVWDHINFLGPKGVNQPAIDFLHLLFNEK